VAELVRSYDSPSGGSYRCRIDPSDLDELIGELYAAPLEEFTSARDALAKRLRVGGERDAAKLVRALRKPSITAWALNRLRDRDPQRVHDLIVAGAELRDAQAQTIASGHRTGLGAAVTRERELVQELVGRAAAELSAGGRAVNEAIERRMFATLHAAAADEEVRTLLAAGRLAGDHEASDFGLGVGAAGTRAPEETPSARRAVQRPDQAVRDLTAARERLQDATRAQMMASEELEAADCVARAAEAALADAEERLRQAASAVRQAESVLLNARQQLEEARGRNERAQDLVVVQEQALAALGKG
jgi:hypothetical protein